MMYISNALIDAMSAYIIHINLNTLFYTHVEYSPTLHNVSLFPRYPKEQTNMNNIFKKTTTECCVTSRFRPLLHNAMYIKKKKKIFF